MSPLSITMYDVDICGYTELAPKGLTGEMPLMEYGHPDSSCSRAPISINEFLLVEHGHLGTFCLCGLW